jgi:hypothetical protein
MRLARRFDGQGDFEARGALRLGEPRHRSAGARRVVGDRRSMSAVRARSFWRFLAIASAWLAVLGRARTAEA